ncbi:substrate-binding domain-containing protein [Mesorhizobium comanense]|uniref:substrate-binding domain-containing protein n=1 Tax=Mesorhizobium comanense TaxID=2502215 RepID=UPI00148503EC|nr:substrate-binding domain-containing protein [Mesorhizobium comanense]
MKISNRVLKIHIAAACLMGVSALQAHAASRCYDGSRKPPFKIGWSNIYFGPTWMKQTGESMQGEVDKATAQNLVKEYQVTNADGDATKQAQQIQAMVDNKFDAIIVIAGSATALNKVIDEACKDNVVVINFDSLVSTDNVTSKINTDQEAWGKSGMKWLAEAIGGKGKIAMIRGPEGVSVSEARFAGAQSALKDYPDIKVVGTVATEYNLAPAQTAFTQLAFANPQIDAVWADMGPQAVGAMKALKRAGRDMVPVTGDNYRPFLELWQENKLNAWGTGQPNWLGALSIQAALKALQGGNLPEHIKVPLPSITNSDLPGYAARFKDAPTDGYVQVPVDQALFDRLLANGS